MLAKDVMTTRVITVLEDTPVEEIARTLLEWRISAVPVVDSSGTVVGIVSEGDLVRRPESGTAGHAWWLSALVQPEEQARRYAKARGHLAKDVMTSDVLSVNENDTLPELAAKLEEGRIKRVPVLRNGRLVGIISRANLLHGLAAGLATPLGYPPGPDAGAGGSVRRQSVPDDAAIRAMILNRLHNELNVGSAINVIVSKGVVDLWGGVKTETERQAVRTVAENAPDVAAVKDHLTVLPVALSHLLSADKPN